MAESSLYNEICLISKGLYRAVSDILGPVCIVQLRRQGLDIQDTLINSDRSLTVTIVTSGSKAEGFEFESSDTDVMLIDRNAIVVTSSNFSVARRNNILTVLVMETENVSPGFAFIRFLSCSDNNIHLSRNLVWRGSGIYVSSKRVRETFLTSSISACHGPCQTVASLGIEGDMAYTLSCPIWPTQAEPFVRRSLEKGWPSRSVLTNICNDGCLLVPINSKQQNYSDMIDLEWRISFSLAEKKLIHSMNHCQFLCYGLSKIFLKECLKENFPSEDLLCSYFMKTAVFWEISENPSEWCPINLLSKFWNVFRRLIKWVSIGYCPNFFIPENNMFYGKICGEAQLSLLETLRDLYVDGYWSLLRCSSLNKPLSQLITQPELANMISYNEEDYVSFFRIEKERLRAITRFNNYIEPSEKEKATKVLENIAMMKTESVEILFAARLRVNRVLHAYAESLFLSEESVRFFRNRRHYTDLKVVQTVLLKTKTWLCMNYFKLIKHMYITGNYQKAAEMIHYILHRLQSQPFMYTWNMNDCIIMAALQQGMPYDTLIKTFIMSDVEMETLTTIEELKSECLALEETTGSDVLLIPPLVFLHFLLLLCYTRLGDNHRRYDVLDELRALVFHDDGYHIIMPDKAISWEILGICQQLCGDRHGAFQSYIHALDEYNYFKQATVARITSLDHY